MPEIHRSDDEPQIHAYRDGAWVPAEPLPYLGWKAKVEQWVLRHGMTRLGRFMGRWDERGLGR
jgi:hypothetical protein